MHLTLSNSAAVRAKALSTVYSLLTSQYGSTLPSCRVNRRPLRRERDGCQFRGFPPNWASSRSCPSQQGTSNVPPMPWLPTFCCVVSYCISWASFGLDLGDVWAGIFTPTWQPWRKRASAFVARGTRRPICTKGFS